MTCSLHHFLRAATVGCAFVSARGQTADESSSPSEALVLDAFTVTSEQDKGYKAANAIGATRMNTPIANIPQSIAVFNDLFIEDTLSFNLTELANYDPTFMPTQADRGTYLARGFSSSFSATFVDGLPQRNTFGPNYTANVDRVEILKGPAAILYGEGPGGATINRVLKRALPTARTTLMATVSDEVTQRIHIDTTGPLGARIADRPLAYRLNLALQEGETFKRESEDNVVHVSPAFHIPLGRNTDLDLNFTYDKTNLTGNFAHPVIGGVPGQAVLGDGTAVHIPIENSFGEPFDERPIEKTLTSYDLRHRFNEHLSLRSQYQYETYNAELSEIFPQIGQYVITPTSASIRRVYREQNTDMNANRARNELAAAFDTGPLSHRTLAGFSFDETNERQLFYQTNNTTVPPIDMVNPRYGEFARPDIATVPVTTDTHTKALARAWYVNELVGLFEDRLFLQAGYRTQDTYQRVNNRRTQAVSAIPTDASTSSFGGVWHLNRAKSLSLWATASEAFEPNFRVNPDGATLPPTTGRSREGGLKFDLLDGVLNGTASIFKTVRENVPESAPDLGDGFFRPGPGQTSQGFELSASYNPSRRFQINGGYAYLDAFATATGKTVPNFAKHSVSAFLRYEQPDGPLKGLFATVGVIYRGTRDPQSATSAQPVWVVPEFKRLDFGLGYGWKSGRVRYRATVNVANATDELLFGDNSQNDRYAMLAPRTWKFSLRLQF